MAVVRNRVGRTLMNYYLMIRGHPPLIVHDEEKGKYYAALQQYDEAEDLAPLYEFFRYETEKTWAKALTLLDGIKPDRKGLSDFAGDKP